MTRKKLPATRNSVTHKVVIFTNQGIDPNEPVEVYITVGCYPDGRPGELFLKTVNEHRGPYEMWAISLSFLLQAKVDFDLIYPKFAFVKFGPAGLTDDPDIRSATSITDYVVRWIGKEFKLIEETK